MPHFSELTGLREFPRQATVEPLYVWGHASSDGCYYASDLASNDYEMFCRYMAMTGTRLMHMIAERLTSGMVSGIVHLTISGGKVMICCESPAEGGRRVQQISDRPHESYVPWQLIPTPATTTSPRRFYEP